MADEVITAAEPASAPAAAAPPAPEPTKQETFEIPRDPKAYEQWRYGTGTPKAESAPAKPKDRPVEGDRDAPGDAAESEPATKEPERLSKPERRLNELLEDLRKAGLSPSELKTYRREVKAAGQPPAEAPERRAEKAPAVDERAPKLPKEDDFKTWEEYKAAENKYIEDLAEYKAQLAVEKFQNSQRQESLQKEYTERLAKAKAHYGAEADTTIVGAAKAIFHDREVPPAVQGILNGSTALEHVLYALGKDASELDSFVELCKRDPGAAIRRVVLTEKLVMEELAKAGAQAPRDRDEDGKFVAQKRDDAPPPPREVTGRSGPPRDAVQRAIDTGNFAAYREEQNRRDLARFKGQ